MATTEATRRNTNRTSSNAARRGAHVPASRTEDAPAEARPVTPAMHITPNVIIRARGDVRSPSRKQRGSSGRTLRRFAV